MSRSPETPKEPDWYQLAIVEAARIIDFRGKEPEIAQEVVNILKSAKHEEYGESKRQILTLGEKSLTLHCTRKPIGKNEWHTVINTLPENSALHAPEPFEPEEATILYIAAKLLMQNIANQTGEMVRYYFIFHKQPKIKVFWNWANATGKVIFGWDHASIHGESVETWFKPII